MSESNKQISVSNNKPSVSIDKPPPRGRFPEKTSQEAYEEAYEEAYAEGLEAIKKETKQAVRGVVTAIAPQFGDLMSLLDELINYSKAYVSEDLEQQVISAAKLRIRGKSFLATTGTLAVFATPAIVLHEFLKNHADSLHRIRSGLENMDKFAANNNTPGLDAQHVIIYAAILLAVTTLLFSWLARSFAGKKALVAELATEKTKIKPDEVKLKDYIDEVKSRDYFVKFGIFAEPPRKSDANDTSKSHTSSSSQTSFYH